MPRGPRPNPDPQLRHAILAAARQVFAQEGLESLSMRRVAAIAGCTATAIYIYFKDKEDLLQALVLEDFLELARDLEGLQALPDPLDRLRALGLAFARYAEAKPDHYRFLFMTPRPAVRPEASLQRHRPDENAYLLARQAAAEALATGRVAPRFQDADALVQTLLSGIHGVVSLHISNFHDPWIPWKPLEARVQLMLETLLRGVVHGPEGTP